MIAIGSGDEPVLAKTSTAYTGTKAWRGEGRAYAKNLVSVFA